MEMSLALSPDLGLSPQAFAAAWNETPDCQTMAQARLDRSQASSTDPQTAIVLLEMRPGMAFGVTASSLYAHIKQALKRRNGSQSVVIDQVELPDGSLLVIVKPAVG